MTPKELLVIIKKLNGFLSLTETNIFLLLGVTTTTDMEVVTTVTNNNNTMATVGEMTGIETDIMTTETKATTIGGVVAMATEEATKGAIDNILQDNIPIRKYHIISYLYLIPYYHHYTLPKRPEVTNLFVSEKTFLHYLI